ncbi:hypothetical protein B0H13DRAFT_2305464 [Mycena leptocephala]|nr:hypothetical protein B0H13DRAFT_2305464 [Mycena leptocephala]
MECATLAFTRGTFAQCAACYLNVPGIRIPTPQTAVAKIEDNPRPEGRRWGLVLNGSLSFCPGRTLVYTSLGSIAEKHANRAAYALGLGSHVIAKQIKSHFGTGNDTVQRLDLLRTSYPPKLEKWCSNLMKYTLPTESASTQCRAFKDIVDLATSFPGLRVVFLSAKYLDGVTSTPAVTALWTRAGSTDEEWSFWKNLAETCLTETTLSAMLERSSVSALSKCPEEGLGVIERLLIEHDLSAAEAYSGTLCVRYLGGILSLSGFWLDKGNVHADVARKLCCGLARILKDMGAESLLLGPNIDDPEAPFDYDGVDSLATTVLAGISGWFTQLEREDWTLQPWYDSFTACLRLLRMPRATELLPYSSACATSSFEDILPTIRRNAMLTVMNTIPETPDTPYEGTLTDLGYENSIRSINTDTDKHDRGECPSPKMDSRDLSTHSDGGVESLDTAQSPIYPLEPTTHDDAAVEGLDNFQCPNFDIDIPDNGGGKRLEPLHFGSFWTHVGARASRFHLGTSAGFAGLRRGARTDLAKPGRTTSGQEFLTSGTRILLDRSYACLGFQTNINLCTRRSFAITAGLLITPNIIYVPSAENLADAPSRGLPASHLHERDRLRARTESCAFRDDLSSFSFTSPASPASSLSPSSPFPRLSALGPAHDLFDLCYASIHPPAPAPSSAPALPVPVPLALSRTAGSLCPAPSVTPPVLVSLSSPPKFRDDLFWEASPRPVFPRLTPNFLAPIPNITTSPGVPVSQNCPPQHSSTRSHDAAPSCRAPAPFANEHILSSSRATDPLTSLTDTKNNVLGPSAFRPHVPADRRLLLWTTPHSLAAHESLQDAGISLSLQARIFEGLLQAHVPETRESYGAGLLRFSQFCDREGIGEAARIPADRFLLAAFVADAIGSCTGKCIRNWLNGLHLWHTYNDAPWFGDDGWLPALKKAADKGGVSFKRPPRGPIAREHLRAYRASLDLSSPRELLIRSINKFTTLRDTCRCTRISISIVNGREVVSIHLVWTKTTGIQGGECILTAVLGADADLCPVWAFHNHRRINYSPPPHTPLFAYRSRSGWEHLTKDAFLRSSAAVFKTTQLDLVFGHSYRIGGSLELLSAGVAPEVVMKLGGWTSLCFLIYWRRLEQILPKAITRAWDERIAEFARAHGHPSDIDSLSFDD